MDDLLRQALMILRAMWSHRWLGLAVAWLVGAIGAVTVMVIPDRYEASARIYVDTESILRPLMSGIAVQPNIEQQVMMLSRTLISRPNVEKLVRMADLDLKIKSKKDQEALIDHVMSTLEIKSIGHDNLYTLAYRDPNPEKAKRVVQSLTSIFVESGLGSKQKDSTTALSFIEEQVKAYEKKLEEAETRLKDFKLRNLDFQISEGKGLTDRLSDIGTALTNARMELHEAENSRDAIKRQISGEEPILLQDTPNLVADVSTPEIDSRIEAQKHNLDTLLQRYTEQHPDVIGARRLIKDLEEQKRVEMAARKKAVVSKPAASSANSNPVYQQLKVSLNETEANIASLRTRVAEYGSQYNRIITVMKTAPQMEAELAQLNRDYSINKKNYESLVERRQSAGLSGELQSTGNAVDFRLIDPPRASTTPVAPNRLLLLPMVCLLSLAAGLVASFIAGQVRPVFFDGDSLRKVSGLPLLGMISLVKQDSQLRLEKVATRRFSIALLALVGTYLAGIIVLSLLSGRGA